MRLIGKAGLGPSWATLAIVAAGCAMSAGLFTVPGIQSLDQGLVRLMAQAPEAQPAQTMAALASFDARAAIAVALTLVLGVGLLIWQSRLRETALLLTGMSAAAVPPLVTVLAWQGLGVALPCSAASVTLLGLTLARLASVRYALAQARHRVAQLYGDHVSPKRIAEMNRDPHRFLSMASENRELTIMFADIRGFTRLSETMEPAMLREVIHELLTAMTQVVHRHGGTVDKYIGDAVMAFWGAPLDDPGHADHAVSAAQAMLEEAGVLRERFRARGWPELSIGIGLNTGVAQVGDLGSRLRRSYTVLGDAVNLASRIEGLTKQFDEPIIVGELTAQRAQAHRFRSLARITVNGRNEPAQVFVPEPSGSPAKARKRSRADAGPPSAPASGALPQRSRSANPDRSTSTASRPRARDLAQPLATGSVAHEGPRTRV